MAENIVQLGGDTKALQAEIRRLEGDIDSFNATLDASAGKAKLVNDEFGTTSKVIAGIRADAAAKEVARLNGQLESASATATRAGNSIAGAFGRRQVGAIQAIVSRLTGITNLGPQLAAFGPIGAGIAGGIAAATGAMKLFADANQRAIQASKDLATAAENTAKTFARINEIQRDAASGQRVTALLKQEQQLENAAKRREAVLSRIAIREQRGLITGDQAQRERTQLKIEEQIAAKRARNIEQRKQGEQEVIGALNTQQGVLDQQAIAYNTIADAAQRVGQIETLGEKLNLSPENSAALDKTASALERAGQAAISGNLDATGQAVGTLNTEIAGLDTKIRALEAIPVVGKSLAQPFQVLRDELVTSRDALQTLIDQTGAATTSQENFARAVNTYSATSYNIQIQSQLERLRLLEQQARRTAAATASVAGGGGGAVAGNARGGHVAGGRKRPLYFQSGGRVPTRGTDTVPAMLSPGEFVVNAAATRQFFTELQAINRGKRPLSRTAAGPTSNSTIVGDIVVNVDGAGGGSGARIGREITSELDRLTRMNTVRTPRSNRTRQGNSRAYAGFSRFARLKPKG